MDNNSIFKILKKEKVASKNAIILDFLEVYYLTF